MNVQEETTEIIMDMILREEEKLKGKKNQFKHIFFP